MTDAREAVFASIREHLSRDPRRGVRKTRTNASAATPPSTPAHALASELTPPPATSPALEERVREFREILGGLGAPVHRAADEGAAAAIIQQELNECGVTSLALSDAPLVQRLASTLTVEERIEASAPRAALLQAHAGLSGAQWGIAETGTLILESESERHRLVSLLPPLHIAVLLTQNLLGNLGEGLRAVSRDHAQEMDRAITFVTGASRTADIELTLVVGVHGPKRLLVILLDSESSP